MKTAPGRASPERLITPIYISISICIYTHTHTHTHTYTHAHTCTHVQYTYICIHTYIHTNPTATAVEPATTTALLSCALRTDHATVQSQEAYPCCPPPPAFCVPSSPACPPPCTIPRCISSGRPAFPSGETPREEAKIEASSSSHAPSSARTPRPAAPSMHACVCVCVCVCVLACVTHNTHTLTHNAHDSASET